MELRRGLLEKKEKRWVGMVLPPPTYPPYHPGYTTHPPYPPCYTPRPAAGVQGGREEALGSKEENFLGRSTS